MIHYDIFDYQNILVYDIDDHDNHKYNNNNIIIKIIIAAIPWFI